MRTLFFGLIVAAMAGTPALAAPDPAGDLLGSFTDGKDPSLDFSSLDIVSASVAFDGTDFRLRATTTSPIGLAGSLYVFGINRGAGTPRLTFGSPPIGAGVLWDAVAILFPDGTGRVVTFPQAGAPTITTLPGVVTVAGDTIRGVFSAGLLPGRADAPGVHPEDYTFTLWSRLRVNPSADGTNAEIADFASIGTPTVPEPASWALMLGGFGAIGGALRSRRRTAVRFG